MRRFLIPLFLLGCVPLGAQAQDSLRYELSGKTASGAQFTSSLSLNKRGDGRYRAVRSWTLKGAKTEAGRLIGVADLQAPGAGARSLKVSFRQAAGLAGSLGKSRGTPRPLRALYRIQGEAISGWVELPGGSGGPQRAEESGAEQGGAAQPPPRLPELSPSKGKRYHVKPASGTSAGDGSEQRPWRTLEEVAATGKLKLLRPGDSLLLYTGNHGSPLISGENAGIVSIMAASGQRPQLARLVVTRAKNWRIKGLTVSPSFGSKPYSGSIVSLAQAASSLIVLEDCFVYTALDSSAWKLAEWLAANNGILAGRGGENLTLRNNHVLNTRFAISVRSPKSLCEGNLITHFSGDGIWVLRDDISVRWNVIKNVYVSAADGDANHDDGIQCFNPDDGVSPIRRAKIHGNLIVSHEDDHQPLPGDLQGIGFFDGPLIGFDISENVVLTAHYHGISLVDAQSCQIRKNLVFSRWEAPSRPWILLGKKRGGSRGNVVQDNYAHAFKLQADPEVSSSNNRPVSADLFRRRTAALKAQIDKAFGARHPLSGQLRIRPFAKSK